jgi:hypothetical protein
VAYIGDITSEEPWNGDGKRLSISAWHPQNLVTTYAVATQPVTVLWCFATHCTLLILHYAIFTSSHGWKNSCRKACHFEDAVKVQVISKAALQLMQCDFLKCRNDVQVLAGMCSFWKYFKAWISVQGLNVSTLYVILDDFMTITVLLFVQHAWECNMYRHGNYVTICSYNDQTLSQNYSWIL